MKIKICFGAILLFAASCLSQWSDDPSTNLRVTTRGLLPQILSDGAGGAYIAYNDMPLLGIHIFVQHLDKYGYRKFLGNGVMVADSSHVQAQRYFLVNDDEGGVIIAFDGSFVKEGIGYTRASAQRIDSSGIRLWGINGVTVAQQDNAYSLDLVAACRDGNNGSYIFWGVFHDRQNIDLMAQHLDSQGNLLWDSSGVKISDQFVSYESPVPCLAVDDEVGGTMFLYYDSTGAILQRMDENGRLLWGGGVKPFLGGWWPNMKKDGLGGVIITGSYNTVYEDNFGWHKAVATQRVDRNGNLLWGENGVVVAESGYQETFAPSIIIDKSINSYIVWQDYRNGSYDVYAQRLNEHGEPQWLKDGIKVSLTNCIKSIHFDFVSGPDSSIIVIWSDYRNQESSLRSQRIDINGNYLWSEDVMITKRPLRQNINVASDGNGGAIVCWYETPPEIGIYSQQINYLGESGKVITTSVKEQDLQSIPQKIRLFHNYPNPFNTDTIIKFHLPQADHVQLRIFNLSGKEVITLLNKNIEAGEEQVKWNGKDQNGDAVSSGIYFICLKINESIATRKVLLIR